MCYFGEFVTQTALQNQYTAFLIEGLRAVSELQSDIVTIPSLLSSLEGDLRVKGGFVHLQRLHQMAYAYGATLIEIVRRKDFGRFFMQRAQTMAEIMAKFSYVFPHYDQPYLILYSANEKKKRQVYRGESMPLLPFETQEMDAPAPGLEISTTGTTDSPYSIEREDVAGRMMFSFWVRDD